MVRVLLDCDGVLGDFAGAVSAAHLFLTGKAIPEKCPPEWDLLENMAPPDRERVVHYISHGRSIVQTMRPLPEACNAVGWMHGKGVDVHVVTTSWLSSPEWDYHRRQWLQAHFKIDPDHVTFTSAKYLIRGDVFVDDKTSHLAEWRAENPKGTAIRWETPYNRHEPWDGVKAHSWYTVVQFAEYQGLRPDV